MKPMRAVGFALLLYILSSIVFMLGSLMVGASLEAPTLGTYAIYWIGVVVIALLLAKWYFRKVPATLKHGFLLGLITIAVSIGIDLISIGATLAAGESIEMFAQMYGTWEFYFTIIIVIATTTYAGFEFDMTYTRPAPSVSSVEDMENK